MVARTGLRFWGIADEPSSSSCIRFVDNNNIMSLVGYAVSSDEDDEEQNEPDVTSKLTAVVPAPHVDESLVIEYKMKNEFQRTIDLHQTKELTYNPRYEDLYAPEFGPTRPGGAAVRKNFLTGHLEETNVSDTIFEEERRQKHAIETAERKDDFFPRARRETDVPADDPDAAVAATGGGEGDHITASSAISNSSEISKKKRKKVKNMDASDIDGYTGPWAQFEDEIRVSKPSDEDQAQIDAWNAKKKKYTMKLEKEEFDEKSNLHIKDPNDYQGRSFLHPPTDSDVCTKFDHVPDRCFLPKKLMHTYTGHTKALTKISWFPRSAHLFLSCAMDGKVKLWETHGQRRCIMTFLGHKNAVRDVCFNRYGDKFLSAGYDRALKLWDSETGQCIKRFNSKSVPFCINFNPDDERSNLFLSGMANKKILCWDSRTGAVCQEYDRHLGAINTVTFVDNNRRFVSTSDDKSIRVWEWDIPVDIKYIADPTMHSVPAVTAAPNGKWIACQMMDNKIQALMCMNRFKLSSKKVFTGHMVAGYSCSPDFSPDMSYLCSGDADGKVFIWDWKTCKLLNNFQAHENVCISTLWHPHETSKLLTAGWDGNIKLWD
jgi:pre-mRNA-processing factor 17